MAYYSLYQNNFYNYGEGDVWINEPTRAGVIIYSIVTPCICLFGITGSLITLAVLLRQELKASIYTYLAVLALADLVLSVLLLLSGLCKGALWYNIGYPQYDAIIGLPLGGFFSCIAVSATVFVSIDRAVFLWNPRRVSKPKFCNRSIARRVMLVSVFLSLMINLPYCFIYAWNENGTKIRTTDFFKSKYYEFHNWLKFFIYGLIPCMVLILGNGFLIYSLKRASRMRKKCQQKCTMSTRKVKREKEQGWVTFTLVAIAFCFIIGEFPTHFVSRKTAVTILFDGDEEKAAMSKELETFRLVSIVLNASDIAINFFLYCLFCPAFNQTLHKMTNRRTKTANSTNRTTTNDQHGDNVCNDDGEDDHDHCKLNQNDLPMSKKRSASVLHANKVQVNVFVLNSNDTNVPTADCLNMSPPDKFLDMLAIQVEQKGKRTNMQFSTKSDSEDDFDDDDENDSSHIGDSRSTIYYKKY